MFNGSTLYVPIFLYNEISKKLTSVEIPINAKNNVGDFKTIINVLYNYS